MSGSGVSTEVLVTDKWVEGGEKIKCTRDHLSPLSGKYNYKIPFLNNLKTKRKNKKCVQTPSPY